MADLEEAGFLNHTHTSSGRVPTDKGYRVYVDLLMKVPKLGKKQKEIIDGVIEDNNDDIDNMLKISSIILGELTHNLACVISPLFNDAKLSRLQLFQLASNRILIVLSVTSGLIKTINLEFNLNIKKELVKKVEELLNKQLRGLTFEEIRNSFSERIRSKGNK